MWASGVSTVIDIPRPHTIRTEAKAFSMFYPSNEHDVKGVHVLGIRASPMNRADCENSLRLASLAVIAPLSHSRTRNSGTTRKTILFSKRRHSDVSTSLPNPSSPLRLMGNPSLSSVACALSETAGKLALAATMASPSIFLEPGGNGLASFVA